MAEWRFARGWSEAELRRRLAEVHQLRRSYDAQEHEMTTERGWNCDVSEAVIAHEQPGAPVPGGPFERAWRLVKGYAFSDPRIVTGYFDPDSQLLGRHMLLSVRVVGLRYLGAVVVSAVRADTSALRTVCGFRYDTLEGHFDRGCEWFLVSKDHRTGEVSFRIQAAWREGDLPNAWSRVGFRLMARSYQRAWHRRAHERLRAMLDSHELEPAHRGAWPAHQQPVVDLASAAALGAVAGARSLLAPALVVRHHRVAGAPIVTSRWGRRLLALLAMGEMVADKSSCIPPRTRLLPLVGRMTSGGLVGAALAAPGRRGVSSLVGAATAAVSAFGLRRLRRHATERLGLSNVAAGLCEDALALGVGLLVIRRLR